jgi:four helix bundle protein
MAFRFRNFKVYQDAKNLHKEITILVSTFPRNYWYLADQMKRSSLSIVLNIAEGSSKQSDKDFNRYLAISLGSVGETIASLEIALDQKLLTKERFVYFQGRHELLSKQLGGFSKFLKVRS